MNIDKYISQFVTDKEVFHQRLEKNPEFARAAAEMCEAFDLRLEPFTGTNYAVLLSTASGFLAGMFSEGRSRTGPNRGDFAYFMNSPVIQKERGRHPNTRESAKVTGIINTMKRNKELPTETVFINMMLAGVNYAFSSIKAARESHFGIELTQLQQAKLLTAFFERDYSAIEADKENYKKQYEKMLKTQQEIKLSKSAAERFRAGSTAIGVVGGGTEKVHYLVGQMSNKDAPFGAKPELTNLMRYDSLMNTPYAGDAAIIRTYASVHGIDPEWPNELGLRRIDHYYEEIDIAVGYDTRLIVGTSSFWVLIPNAAK